MARVMIAEDSDATRILLKEILKEGQHEIVDEAMDGVDAVKKFNLSKPDILLLDYAMPKKDGLTVLKEIKMINPYAKVIMITVNDDQELIEGCITAGALAYIIKPFKTPTVLKAISYALED